MRRIRFLLAPLIVALMVGVGASTFWAGHAGSGGSPLRAFQPGWVNLAWVNDTTPIDTAFPLVTDSVGVVYYLDPDSGGWQRYIPGRPEISNLTTLVSGEAYLVLFTGPVILDMEMPYPDVDLYELCSLVDGLADYNSGLQTLWRNLQMNPSCTQPATLGHLSIGACADSMDWEFVELTLGPLDDTVSSLELWCLVNWPARPAGQ